MDDQYRAQEHLRIIRRLMERATIYRTISAPTALIGGLLSLLLSLFFLLDARRFLSPNSFLSDLRESNARSFVLAWVIVLVLTLIANTCFIWRKAKREGTPVLSSGLKLALSAVLPPLLIVAVLTGLICSNSGTDQTSMHAVIVWMIGYGLALLATAQFAPRSLVVLGWAFLTSGLLAVLTAWHYSSAPAIAMGITFGFYHLIYAVCVWPREREVESATLSE